MIITRKRYKEMQRKIKEYSDDWLYCTGEVNRLALENMDLREKIEKLKDCEQKLKIAEYENKCLKEIIDSQNTKKVIYK